MNMPTKIHRALCAAYKNPSTYYPGWFVVWDEDANTFLAETVGVYSDSPSITCGEFNVKFSWDIQKFLIQ